MSELRILEYIMVKAHTPARKWVTVKSEWHNVYEITVLSQVSVPLSIVCVNVYTVNVPEGK